MALPRSILLAITGTALLLGVQACTKPPAQVDTKRLLNANAEPGQWMTHSRTFDEQYFSPLDKINDGNVGKLGLAWYVDLPTNQNVETTPLMIDGVLYVTLPWSMVMAVDAKTGKQLWLHDPQGRQGLERQHLLRRGQPRRGGMERQDHLRHAGWPADRAGCEDRQ